MKIKVLTGFITASLAVSTVAHADFIFNASEPDVCQVIAGQWAGSGSASNWLFGTCVYHGSGIISPVDSEGKFSVDVKADKDSGGLLCPRHTSNKFTGTCHNGVVVFITEYGSIAGSFSQNAGEAKGTLNVAPGMNAEVNVQFQKMG